MGNMLYEDIEEEEEEEQNSIEEVPKIDFYGILNLPKNATQEDIKDAYKRMCMMFHPDKHADPVYKIVAEKHFSRIKQAFDVLSDQSSRSIYDVYGVEGLSMNLQIGPYLRMAEDVRLEFEKRRIEKEIREMQRRSNPKSSLSIGLDATQIFNPYDPYDGSIRRLLTSVIPEINQFNVLQSVEASVSDKDRLTMMGTFNSRNGRGIGGLLFSWQRQLSSVMNGTLSLNAGDVPFISLATFRNFGPFLFGQTECTLVQRPDGINFGYSVTGGRRLSRHWTSSLTYHGGWQSGLDIKIHRISENSAFITSIQLDPVQLEVKYDRILSKKSRLKAEGILGSEPKLRVGGDRRLSKYSRIGTFLELGYMSGLSFVFKFSRSGQVFKMPVLLNPTPSPTFILVATLIPIGIGTFIKKKVIDPKEIAKKNKKLERLRRANADSLRAEKSKADEAVLLMKEKLSRKIEFEESRQGLIVVEAKYGNLKANSQRHQDTEFPPTIDVTIPVQSLVNNSRLQLHEGSKAVLQGFYDPCPGEDKQLQITYRFGGKLHQVIIDDLEKVAAPLKAHIMS